MTTKLLHEEIQQAAEAIRSALRGLIEQAGCNPLKPQAVHRHIGVDRVLCWKVSRLIRAERVEEALLQLPGEEALSIFIAAFERTTASAAQIDKARTAAVGLNQAIADHVGDRRTLLLMLDSVPGGQDALGQSRKLLFRGASGVWGIQARERVHVLMLAPNKDNPALVDSVFAAGWVDVKRMRPDARWRMMKVGSVGDTSAQLSSQAQPLSLVADESVKRARNMLVPEFCADIPEMIITEEKDGSGAVSYEIGPSATGRVGAFTIFLGIIQRAHGPLHANEPGDSIEFGANIFAPVEHLTLDVFVHRDLRLHDNAEVAFYSAAFNLGTRFSPFNRMPIEIEPSELEGKAALENTHHARQAELVNFMLDRAGWQFDDFTAMRYDVDYPPFPSVAVFRAPLQQA